MDLKRWLKFDYIHVLLLFSTTGVVLSQQECSTGLSFPGYTVPNGDITIEYGGDLNILCILYNNNSTAKYGVNASRLLSFNRNNKTIPPEMIEIVNSTAIRLRISKPPKVSMDHYKCLVNNTEVVCMNFVTVGTKPQEVTDFSCIGQNYENLTCSWTPSENYVKTEYILTYRLNGRSGRSVSKCPQKINPDSKDPHMRCFWNVSTTPHYRQAHDEYHFNLTMTNEFGTTQMNKTFKHFAHVLSGPPENLTVVSRTPSSMYLAWTIPLSMQAFPPGLHHRIMYQSVFGEKIWHMGAIITNQMGGHTVHFNLTNLKYAHALYDIRVSLRSAAALPEDKSMWSRNASITERTKSKVPDEPPETGVGFFEVIPSSTSLQTQEAFIYWKQIKEEQRNGPLFRYEVSIAEDERIKPVEMLNAYAKFVNLSISKSYTFNIWSVNSEGRSLRKSTVFIPNVMDRIKPPSSFTKTLLTDGVYEVDWKPPEDRRHITNYTIFWCSNTFDRPHQCKGELYSDVVSNTNTTYNATVKKDSVYQFAISANTENGSSGMLWAACTILRNKVLGKMKNVYVDQVNSTYIIVRWKLECSDQIGNVEGYIVYYCPIKSPTLSECKGSQKNVTVKGDIESANITHLQPYTTYMLTVAVITKYSTFSQQSDPLYNTTLEDAPSSPRNLTVVDITNSSVSLTWQPPNAINGVLKEYIVEYNGHTMQIGQQTNVTIPHLNSYENYMITIKACTTRYCSNGSATVNETTKMGYPSQIRKPTVDRRNDTTITIVWSKPDSPNGLNNYYTIQFKQKHKVENITKEFNVTDRKYVIENCGDGGKYNTFYLSVRAINIINNKPYGGPWSDELENYCDTPINYIMYLLSVLVIAFFVGMAILFNRLYKHYKIMRDVEVKLPPGLAPVVADREHTLVPWNTEIHHRDNRDSHSPPDEELLLNKLSEGKHLSGDSSGCSSGHESVSSSLESGTHISSSSDSGTEQAGSYSVLGIDPKTDSSYVPVSVDSMKVGYKTCDVSNNDSSSPYVMTGEAVKTINPGYIPFNQTEPLEKSSGYVVAGIKNGSGYMPFNQTETVNRNTGYVVAGIKNCKLD